MQTQNKSSKIKYFILADRIAAWILLIVVLVYGITGYGLTKGLISADLSRALHLGWLGAIGLVAFVIHTVWATHLVLRRHNWWNGFSKICLATCYAAVVVFFLWVHFFYQPNYSVTSTKNSYTNIVDASTNTNSNLPVFTAETLRVYNGLNGQPAYVAVKGVVYDMSRVFRNGKHYGYTAGQDLTEAFYSEHTDRELRGLTVVGTYQ